MLGHRRSKPLGVQTSRLLQVLFTLSFLLMDGCGTRDEHPGGTDQYHQLIGLVLAVDSSSTSITISHGDIPHSMKAMTMTFKVRDPKLLVGVEPGDSVRGIIAVHRPDVRIDSLTVLSKMPSETRH